MAVDDFAGFVFVVMLCLPSLENASIGVDAHTIAPAVVYAYPQASVLGTTTVLMTAFADGYSLHSGIGGAEVEVLLSHVEPPRR